MSLGFCRAGEVKKVKRQNGGPPSVDKGSLREPAVEAVAGTGMYLTVECLCTPKSLVSILSTMQTNKRQ